MSWRDVDPLGEGEDVSMCSKSSIEPLISNKLPIYRERKLISSPSLLSPPPLPPIIFYLWIIDLINHHDCKTSFELIRDGLFTCWRSDLFLIVGCMTSNFLFLSFSTLHSTSFWRVDTAIFGELNKLPSQISLPSLLSPPQTCYKFCIYIFIVCIFLFTAFEVSL